MSKEDSIISNGRVIDSLPNAMFKVQLDNNQTTVIAQVCGKMRKNNIKVLLGDAVEVEISVYDLGKGRIIKRI